MDVIKFLQEGHISKNPNYNPKTKKGRLQPPYLVSNDPGSSLRDQGNTALFSRLAGESYNLGQYDIDKYTPYNVYVNPVQTQEELDKERALNQSNWEQAGHAIGQSVNQATVGTVVGMADLADAVYNWFTDKPQDYQSEAIRGLENFKKSIDERLAIYRENPNAAFDVTDFAWWASNVPSLVTSISLMVPGLAVTKGAGLLGNAVRFNKVANKIANAANISNKSRNMLSKLGESISTGTTMRYLENYQEARQTYDDVYTMSINNLNKMSNKQYAEFIKNNPQYENKSNEEIAANIAENSADVTFTTDWANVFFDIAQVYSLGNIWKTPLQGQTTAKLSNLNKTAATMFGKDAATITESIAAKGIKDKTITSIKNIGKDIATGVRAEWTEGIEEAINYIASQEGLYAGQKIFDKNSKRNTLKDYLSDAHLWEQAFWGAIGGVVFSGIMNKTGEFANKKLNKDWIKAEEQKEAEILGRSILTQDFQNKLAAIAENKNPYNNNQPIVPGTEDTVKAMAEQEYVDNLVMGALNVGNGKLLKEFASDSHLVKGIQEKLGLTVDEAAKLQQRLIASIDRVENTYNNTMNKVNRLGGDFNTARIIASKVARGKISKELHTKHVEWAETLLNNDLNQDGIDVTQLETQDALQQIYRNTLASLNKEIENIEDSADIDARVKSEMIADVNDRIAAVNELLLPVEGSIRETQQAALNKIATEHANIGQDLAELAGAQIRLARANKNLDISDSNIKRQIKEIKLFTDQAVRKIVKGAYEDIRKMVEKYSGEIIQDVAINGNSNDNVDAADALIMRKAYKALKLNAPNDKYLENTINDIIDTVNHREDVKPIEEETAPENPMELNDEEKAIIETNEVEEIKAEYVSSSTGGREKTVTAESAVAETVKSPEPIVAKTKLVDTLPTDDWDRAKAIEDIIYNYIFNNPDINENNDDSIISSEKSIIDYLVGEGIALHDATQEVKNVIDALTGRYSSIADRGLHKLVRNAAKAALTGNEKNIESVIKDFAESVDSEGNVRGKTVNGITYVSIGQLIEYLSFQTNNKLIKDYLFSQLKSYLYSQAGKGKYRATDDATIKELSDRDASTYIDEITKARVDRLRGLRKNNVNVEFLNNDDLFDNFTTIKQNDELGFEIDNQKNRIIIIANNKPIGYMGVPNVVNGNYQRYNMSWNYNIDTSKEGMVAPLKDFFIDILDGARANDEFLAILYNLATMKQSEITDEMLVELYDKMIELYPDASNFINTNEPNYNIRAALHLVNITQYVLNDVTSSNNHRVSINKWFTDLLNSYDQAISIKNGKFKGTIKAAAISYGMLNTEQTTEFIGSNLENAIIGYNENQHELMVTVPDKASGRNKTYTSHGSVNGVSPVASNGLVVVKIPKPDGSFTYAHCRQTMFNEDGFSNETKTIQKLITEEVVNLVKDFLDKKIDFNQFETAIKDLIGEDALITGVGSGNYKNNRSARGFYYGNQTFFNVNDAQIKYARNVVIPINDGKRVIIKSTSESNFEALVVPAISNYIQNAKFAVGKSFIGDSNYDTRDTNKYIKRKNNKTVITLGGREFVYNSYQDFLVKNNAIKTKLLGGQSNNWLYNPNMTKLDIVYELEETTSSTSRRGAIPELSDDGIINTSVNVDNISKLIAVINSKTVDKAFRDYFNGDEDAMSYISELQRIQMLPSRIVIDNTLSDDKGNPVFGAYFEHTDIIKLNLNAFVGMPHTEVVRTAVHERVHQLLTTYYNKEKLITNVGEVFDEFIEWFNNASAEEQAQFKPFTYQGLSREQAVEEFIVESLTMPFFMEKLNEIKTKAPIAGKKKQTLLNKLLNLIASFFNIKINEDSLLAKLNNYYSQASKQTSAKSVAKKVDAVQTELDFKEEADSVAEESTKPKGKKKSNATFKDDNAIDYSTISQYRYRNLTAIIESVPSTQQAEFARLLNAGTISFACV